MVYIDMSLVIASYNGYKKIINLLNSLLQSQNIPKEIIIVCHTEQFNKYRHYTNRYKNKLNIIIYKSIIKNQIIQRQIGLKKTTKKYIMQLDDDILVNKSTLKTIYNELIKNNYKIILCANLKNFNGLPADIRWKNIYNKYSIFRIIILMLNKFKRIEPYTILESGRPVPGFRNYNLNYEWLNSSLCFHRSALKDYEYFSELGKAYYEDVYTSHSFHKKGYELKKIKNATIYHPETEKMNINIFLQSTKNQYKILKKFNKNKFLFIIDVILFSVIFAVRKK